MIRSSPVPGLLKGAALALTAISFRVALCTFLGGLWGRGLGSLIYLVGWPLGLDRSLDCLPTVCMVSLMVVAGLVSLLQALGVLIREVRLGIQEADR